MRTTTFWLVFMLLSSVAFAQRSVMLDDLTSTEIQAAVAAGKTTLIFYVGGTHENAYWNDEHAWIKFPFFNGPDNDSTAVSKHNIVANYLARRVAEELGNALALRAFPHSPNGDAATRAGHMLLPGTVSLRDETFAAVLRDVATSAVISTGFKHVIMLSDNGGGQDVMKKVADELDREWSSEGVRFFFFPVYEEAKNDSLRYLVEMDLPAECRDEQLSSWPPPREVMACVIAIDDAAEVMFLDDENKWVRKDKLAPAVAGVITPGVGQVLIEQKVKLAVAHIRGQLGRSQSR